jgi:hypothetical protein
LFSCTETPYFTFKYWYLIQVPYLSWTICCYGYLLQSEKIMYDILYKYMYPTLLYVFGLCSWRKRTLFANIKYLQYNARDFQFDYTVRYINVLFRSDGVCAGPVPPLCRDTPRLRIDQSPQALSAARTKNLPRTCCLTSSERQRQRFLGTRVRRWAPPPRHTLTHTLSSLSETTRHHVQLPVCFFSRLPCLRIPKNRAYPCIHVSEVRHVSFLECVKHKLVNIRYRDGEHCKYGVEAFLLTSLIIRIFTGGVFRWCSLIAFYQLLFLLCCPPLSSSSIFTDLVSLDV